MSGRVVREDFEDKASTHDVKRKPEDTREELAARVMQGIPLETWAVVTRGNQFTNLWGASSQEDAEQKLEGLYEAELRSRLRGLRPVNVSHHVEYLVLDSVQIAATYRTSDPPVPEATQPAAQPIEG